MSTWTNEDGLVVRFGETRAEVRPDGSTSADERLLVIDLPDATALATTDTAASTDAAYLPAGAILRDAYFVVDTAFTSGGSATLDIGLKQANGTNIDDDGIDAAIAVASLTANSVTVSNGALVPSKLANDSYVMFTYNTAAFTAGAGKLVVKYVID